ncbi:gamma-glutamyltransferase [Gemmatimonas sp.]|uniref:gamma-glutamyltransferase family protein n=1 Tax=Gemmatimonas sp. TaxID=1962908 RepID=UPI003F6F7C0D
MRNGMRNVMRTFTIARAGALLFAVSAVPLASSDAQTAVVSTRKPTLSSQGDLVFERQGLLYLVGANGTTTMLSSGSAYHRDPFWAGNTLYWAADSGGHYAIYARTRDSATGSWTEAARRVTNGAVHEVAPTAGGTRFAFQRGLGNASRVWVRDSNSAERRAFASEQTERRPRLSADGKVLAYIVETETGRKVVANDRTVYTDTGIEDIALSPTGDRIAVSTRAGVVVVPVSGESYTNLVSRAHGDVDWSADGQTISIAEFREISVSYNGDPDRGVDRAAHEKTALSSSATPLSLHRLPAPVAPDARRVAVTASMPGDRSLINAAAFDRVWERSARLYYGANAPAEARAQWAAARDRVRPQAMKAESDSALQASIHALLQAAPPRRRDATGNAAVSSAHPVATEAGLEIFRLGGNVVDAAVAVSFALGVVEPDASGIGGYGEMVIALKGKQPTLIEFMSRVPEEGGLTNTSLLVNGRYPSDGPVLVNVPGTVAGMYLAWQQHGSKKATWAQLVAPAIRAARNGYEVSEGLATTLAIEREHFAKYEGSRALFFRNGAPMQRGDTVRNADLAWVLEQISARGADGFYKGDVAAKYAGDLRAKGNAMKVSDLARYFANERAPVCGSYRRYRVCSSAPPVSGGADLVARLNLLERFPTPRPYPDDAATMHAMLSAWFLTPSSRNRIADPAMWPVDVSSIVNKDTAAVRWQCYSADRALTPRLTRGDTLECLKPRPAAPATPAVPPANGLSDVADAPDTSGPCGDEHAREMAVCHAAGTTAYTVADADGNAVAVTQTLGTWGGNFYVTPGLGFLSNDKLTSYGTDATQYGSRLPFARHGSTLAPTIAFEGTRPVFAVGAAGNAWITSAVYQSLVGALDFGLGAQAALELPRFLPSGTGVTPAGAAPGSAPFNIQLEDGFAPQVTERLRTLGYELTFVTARGEVREGYGGAIRIGRRTVTAGADPRRAGAAGAIR